MGRTSDAKERLMDAALDLIWEESYGAVTIEDICQRADVKKGSFYYFFDSKTDLSVAALEHLWLTRWKPALDATFSPSREPLDRLRSAFDALYQKQVEVKKEHGKVLGCPLCSVGSEVSTQDEDPLVAKVREIYARKRRYYESAIRDAVADGVIEPCDPAVKADNLYAVIEGFVAQARILNNPEVLRRLPDIATEMLHLKPATARAPASA